MANNDFNYAFELHTFNEALTPYGTIETDPPSVTNFLIDDFEDGEHFRTTGEDGFLTLDLEDRLLTVLLDESGSMTWNDNNKDRYEYLKRLLTKLDETYPGQMTANLIGFGGVLTDTTLFLAQANVDFLTTNENAQGTSENQFNNFLRETFQDSVFDFAGVRVVRRSDRFPTHPADGIVVAEGILKAVKDEDLVQGTTYYYGIWVFNQDLQYSLGQFITAIPQDRILPNGVNFSDGTVRKLPGISRDDFTQIIWTFVEGEGTIIFDSSSNGRHGTASPEIIQENFWLGDAGSGAHEGGGGLKKPVGVRFDGEFDIVETAINSDLAYMGTSTSSPQSILLNVWVFRYASTSDLWVAGTSMQDASNTIGWALGIKDNGNIGFQTSDITSGFDDIGVAIPEKEWTMVTARMGPNTWRFYVNGALVASVSADTSLDTSAMDTFYVGAKPVDSENVWSGKDFFGSLNLVSVSNDDRDEVFIAELYEQELKTFNQPATTAPLDPPDNRQREVLLTWEVAEDFNYAGGKVKIQRKYRSVPAHDEDGTTVTIVDAEPGQFFYLDTFDFTNNSDYYYRIFTQNTLGNYCDRLEARIVPAHIPLSKNTALASPLFAVANGTVTNGNKKIFLEWSKPKWRPKMAWYKNFLW